MDWLTKVHLEGCPVNRAVCIILIKIGPKVDVLGQRTLYCCILYCCKVPIILHKLTLGTGSS